LGLVNKYQRKFYLTDLGIDLLNRDGVEDDRLNEQQVELLASFVIENPFYSSATYTILALVESVFVLAKSKYPVRWSSLQDYFIKSVGKTETWNTPKAQKTATYIFSNYACELQFLARVDNHFYLSPKGMQAILLLQLNRSIKLIEAQ
jgi:hypothetical protein